MVNFVLIAMVLRYGRESIASCTNKTRYTACTKPLGAGQVTADNAPTHDSHETAYIASS